MAVRLRDRRVLAVLVAVIAVAAAGAAVGGTFLQVSSDRDAKVDEILGRRDLLLEEEEALDTSIAELEPEATRLQEEASNLRARADDRAGDTARLAERIASLEAQNARLSRRLENLPKTPDLVGMSTDSASSALASIGLGWITVSEQGTCADYESPDFRWATVTRQIPAPGTPVTRDSVITLYEWDYYSNWEFGCRS
jgi:hypothetical protein